MLIIFNANKFKPKAPVRLEDIPIHLNDRGPMREGIPPIELSENYLVRFIPDQSFPRDIFLKIAWTRILPDDVQKVICMDTDVLFAQDVRKLWDIFDRFNDYQMIAGAFELTDNLIRDMATPEYPIMETGINSGVLLLHLERMRLAHWDTVSVELTKRMLKSKGRLKYPDQEVYNSFLFENKKFFYELPCQWNLVISRCHQVRKCSAVWIVSDVSKVDCLAGSEKFVLPGLLHICTGFKPEEQKHKVYANPYPVRSVREFTMNELEDAFFEVYFAFRDVDERCFQ
ncbi:unnamed protein product [Calicophoron daubneyi]|uniref:UDP-D-xylose:beta-D-glucoside alpha-1,3-D-xylosyltransferase n=1 Tax=Calicophoron daubneyi TaxID=300641 RepID=A0AAV2TR75_CALDB